MSRTPGRLRSPGEGPRQARPTTPGDHHAEVPAPQALPRRPGAAPSGAPERACASCSRRWPCSAPAATRSRRCPRPPARAQRRLPRRRHGVRGCCPPGHGCRRARPPGPPGRPRAGGQAMKEQPCGHRRVQLSISRNLLLVFCCQRSVGSRREGRTVTGRGSFPRDLHSGCACRPCAGSQIDARDRDFRPGDPPLPAHRVPVPWMRHQQAPTRRKPWTRTIPCRCGLASTSR